MSKQILEIIKDEIKKMNDSIDVGYVETYIPWNRNRGFSVECKRLGEDCKLYDEDNELVEDNSGYPVAFEVYYQVDKKDVDCCTLSNFLSEYDMQSLKEFVDMYR